MKIAMGTRRGHGMSPSAGFSLVELLVTLVVVAEILIIAGLMFDLHNKTAKAQNQVAEMQQSLRVGQREMIELVRMAGRGGLPSHLPVDTPGGIPSADHGLAIHVDNNVDADFRIDPDKPDTQVVPGTDVLRVRGVFSSPLYQLASSALAAASLQLQPVADDPGSAESGTVDVTNPSPSGFPQDLTPLLDPARVGAAVLLVSPLSDTVYGVVRLSSATVQAGEPANPLVVRVSFTVAPAGSDDPYRKLFASTVNLPSNLTSVAFLGFLEEHAFFVREAFAIPGDATSEPQSKLTRVEVLPGSGTVTGAGAVDLADNVRDLQVALGFNSGADGTFFPRDQLDELVLTETVNGAEDDWLFNGPDDDPTENPWAGGDDPVEPRPELYYVRVSTLVRTEGREFQYISPPIDSIEDRVYDEPRLPSGRDPDREFHRRLLRTIVGLRNL
jgi:type II secretory pathway pseudopilin PulG